MKNTLSNNRPLTPDELKKAEFIRDFLFKNVSKNYSLKELAAQCDTSQNFIKTRFRLAFGKPRHQLLLDYRMELATQLLKEKYSTKYVSITVGYGDSSAFTKAYNKWKTKPKA